jgi:hypothetical protein
LMTIKPRHLLGSSFELFQPGQPPRAILCPGRLVDDRHPSLEHLDR